MSTKIRVGITGAHGLLGWHIRCLLASIPEYEPVAGGRVALASRESAVEFVENCDVVVHCAGMNRGTDADIETTNVTLAELLVDAFDQLGVCPYVVYTNSVQRTRETAYGRSKHRAAEILAAWAERAEVPFVDLVLPHVFGEDGRPFYNSVVSTFCHQLAAGESPTVENDGDLELVHAQEVAERIANLLSSKAGGQVRLSGRAMKVSELLAHIESLAGQYRDHRIPDLRDSFDRALFSTFRSYLYPDHYPTSLTLRSDARGSLFEAVKTDNGGQTFMSTTRSGMTRGEHYHLRKFERFLVVQGEAVIRLRRMFSKDIVSFEVSGDHLQYVDMPALYAHNITNTGTADLLTLFWTDEVFDPTAPDTFSEPV